MIEVNGKTWDKLNNIDKIAYCEELLTDAKKNRQKYDFEWYTNHQFIEGNHYIKYNSITNAIENLPRKQGEVRVVVNKIRSAVRAITNYAVREKPKWEVTPGDTDPDTARSARIAGKFLDYWYRVNHNEVLVRSAVDSALRTSIAWAEPYFDERARKGQGEVKVKLHDSFDIYFDSKGKFDEGRFRGSFIGKIIERGIPDVRADKKYDEKARKLVTKDGEPDISSMKKRIITKEQGGSEKSPTVTVKELFLYDYEGNSKNGSINIFTYAGDQVLRDEETEEQDYFIYLMQASQNSNRILQRSWVADAIPLNKAMDRTVSQKIMYVNQALIFRISAEKGHGVNVIHNETGEIIERNRNVQFEQMQMHPLPSTADSLTYELDGYIQDTMGAHDASLGGSPRGARSGRQLEALQAADSNNLADLGDSLETFLSILGQRILELAARHYSTSRLIKLAEPEDGDSTTMVIGEKSDNAEGLKEKGGATILLEDNEIIVSIGSWLGHTVEAKRETLQGLYESGAIPAEELLRQYQFPNISELSEKAREERLEKHKLDAEIAGRNQGQGREQGGGEEATTGDPLVALADKENLGMMNGDNIPSTEGATSEHTQAHVDFMNSKTYQQSADETINSIFTQHIQGESSGQ